MTTAATFPGAADPAQCQYAVNEAAGGVASALRAVDCVAAEVTGDAFARLFGSDGALITVLTILLTLYVAFFAINLLTGRSALGVRALTPRMITLGLVLTFATSWVAYQSVVWNLTIGAPDWRASVLTDDSGSATATFAGKVDVVFAAVEQAQPEGTDASAFSPEGMLWLGAMLFMLGTVGVLVTSRIALAVLVALGPIFVVMALFNGTRGLFTGWLKAAAMLALVPLFAVLTGTIMLELAVPVLGALTAVPGQIEARAAMAFFMLGAVHVALMIMVLKVTGTMVAGWRVFGLVTETTQSASSASAASTPSQPATSPAGAVREVPASAPHEAYAQRTAIAAATPSIAPPPQAANDVAGGSQGGARVTNITNTSSRDGRAEPLSQGAQRTSGIGTRFKPAPQRLSEKIK